MKAPTPRVVPEENPRGYPHGCFNRDGRWIPGGSGNALVAGIVRDLIRRRRQGGSPQDFVLWLKDYPLSDDAVRLLGQEFTGKLSEFSFVDDWSVLGLWERTDLACWVRHCGRPLKDHRWLDNGQWVKREGT